ncbi:antibiotic biosynthesis monooxygenase [Georgenia sp. SYP-B2076]|uniref:antibiotic biosynthesis monooxygenase family protein n=1 Tax=Georgenia sp. SYP-B2076 TaxID=2495881 RepID=UPI000F8E0091|nr:antibiotic biosynthesis monooxygenase family protein [Georgenia sp. SYP-B2076]
MSIVKINAITVPADSGDELAKRFAARAGVVDGVDGFEGFELLQPTDGRTTWLVVTRWRDEASYDAWVGSASFAAGHGGGDAGGAGAHGAGESGGAHGTGDAPRQRPVGVSAELWSFDVAGGSAPAR